MVDSLEWLLPKLSCTCCKQKASMNYVNKIGIYTTEHKSGKMFVEFYCPNCGTTNVADYKKAKQSIEDVCLQILNNSKKFTNDKKVAINRLHLDIDDIDFSKN